MKIKAEFVTELLERLDCFGDYIKTNPVCTKHCALRLRCAIEQDQISRMELLSDLASADGTIITYQ